MMKGILWDVVSSCLTECREKPDIDKGVSPTFIGPTGFRWILKI
jgi:hypothetical protein